MKRPFVLTPEAKNDRKDIFVDIAEDSPDTAGTASEGMPLYMFS